MAQTLILSGPTANRSQCANALGGVGFQVDESEFNWGFPAMRDGSVPAIPQSFVTLCGDDLNLAIRTARQYGYVLRSHFPDSATGQFAEVAPNSGVDVVDEVRALRAQVNALLKKAGK